MKKNFSSIIILVLMFIHIHLNAQWAPGVGNLTTYDNVGIGTTTPAGLLHLLSGCPASQSTLFLAEYDNTCYPNSPPDYFIARNFSFGPPPGNLQYNTEFIIKGNGDVGIGTAEPMGTLHIKNHGYNGDPNELGLIAFAITNDNDEILAALLNTSQISTSAGALFAVRGQSNHILPAFAIFNDEEEIVAFAAYGDGTVGIGFDDNAWGAPLAQVDIRNTNHHDKILRVGSNYTDDLFSIRETGQVVIGQGAPTNAATMLRVEGDGHVTEELGIGIEAQNTYGSTVALRGSSATVLALYPPIDGGSDNNMQINFCNSSGLYKHSISDYEGNLRIRPGLAGAGGNALVKIEGSVQIGDVTTPCNPNGNCYSLYVEKGILAERVRCSVKTSSYWSDYVFDRGYKLMSLQELEKYVIKNKHLPNIPSAEEVCRDGIDLTEMNAKLLAKVEELTLYLISLQKEIEQLKKKKLI